MFNGFMVYANVSTSEANIAIYHVCSVCWQMGRHIWKTNRQLAISVFGSSFISTFISTFNQGYKHKIHFGIQFSYMTN